jgi:uncharacterized protein (DUF488 family)
MDRDFRVVTIGVYGFDERSFFDALVREGVDTFCDTRRRRGLRGSTYAFANSARLQHRLSELRIRYVHCLALAPTEAVRELQRQEDSASGTAKRTRLGLGEAFIEAYRRECLAEFDLSHFREMVGREAHVVALFCVEREPGACHRSLVAEKLSSELANEVRHILP